MLAGNFMVTASDAMNKLLLDRLSAAQIVLIEALFAVVALVAISPWLGPRRVFFAVNWKWQLLRAVLTVASVYFFMMGLSGLPLSTVGVLSFANPLFITALAPWILGERRGMHHWAAVLVGFGGVVIVAQPSTSGFSYLVIYPLASALCGAVRDLVTRRMGTHDMSQSMMFYSMLGLIFASLIAVRGDAIAVPARDFLLITAASAAYLIGLYCVIEALRAAEVSTVAPFKYSNLVWVTAFDVILWGHVPGSNVFVGAGVIIAAMLYVYRRERAIYPTETDLLLTPVFRADNVPATSVTSTCDEP